jgi:hypothetical protein
LGHSHIFSKRMEWNEAEAQRQHCCAIYYMKIMTFKLKRKAGIE